MIEVKVLCSCGAKVTESFSGLTLRWLLPGMGSVFKIASGASSAD